MAWASTSISEIPYAPHRTVNMTRTSPISNSKPEYQVRFSGEEPTLALATSTPIDVVECTSPTAGSFADSLSFLYVVSPGDYSSDLSYTDTGALSFVSDTNSSATSVASTTEIVDESGNPANVTLPPVGSELSVTGGEEWEALEALEAGSGALVVDTSNVVLYVTALNGDGIYYTGESIFIQARPMVFAHETSSQIQTVMRHLRVGLVQLGRWRSPQGMLDR